MNEQADRPEQARQRLEQEAERVRARLASDIDELKTRGRQVAEPFERAAQGVEQVKETLRRHPGIAVGIAAGAAVALGIVFFVRRGRARRAQRRDAILGIAAKLLGPAYVVEPAQEHPGVIKRGVKQAGSALLTLAGKELGRRALLAISTPELAHERAPTRGPA
jgi:ElaB/YqjD/DUF883 family membrane-anchored ribosome-binding protein